MNNIQTNLIAEFEKKGFSSAKFTLADLQSRFEKNGVWVINGHEYDSKHVKTIFANYSVGPGSRVGESVKRGAAPLFIKHLEPATYSIYSSDAFALFNRDSQQGSDSNKYASLLEDAVKNYGFPPIYYDFSNDTKVKAESMSTVEQVIKAQLTANSLEQVKHGLANVVYWGNANAGYQMHRTNKILNSITSEQLTSFQQLVASGNIPTLKQIKSLKMPQFSGVSFISKIVAFLDPDNHCVLDLLLSRLAPASANKALGRLQVSGQIGVTKVNMQVYKLWCEECARISKTYFNNRYRVVDIERGFFKLIQDDELPTAQEIYAHL